MKEYIKLFEDLNSANGYEINDLPFICTVKSTGQNVCCNEENMMLQSDGEELSVVNKPSTITFTVHVLLDQYSYMQDGGTYIEHADPGMTFAGFVNSEYNNQSREDQYGDLITPRYEECYWQDRFGYSSVYFGTEAPYDEYGGWDFRGDYSEAAATAANNLVLEDGAEYYYWYQPYCLLGDTEVTMADRTVKQIKDIEVGDQVLSLDLETGEEVTRTVIFTDSKIGGKSNVWDEWVFSDGTIIKTAYRHEFFNVEDNKFKYLDEWKMGERTYKLDHSTPKLIKHITHTEEVNHYKITLECSTNFFANGLLTGDRYCNDKRIKINNIQ